MTRPAKAEAGFLFSRTRRDEPKGAKRRPIVEGSDSVCVDVRLDRIPLPLPYPKVISLDIVHRGCGSRKHPTLPEVCYLPSSGGQEKRALNLSLSVIGRSRIPFPLKHILGTDSPKQNRQA